MKIKVLSWKSTNLRCPDMEISFNQANKINFIQMPNGTGKTTLIKLIKNTLSNSWKDVKSFQDNEILADEGEFELALSFEVDNTKNEINFRTVFDFSSNKAQCFTTTSAEAELPRFNPDKKLKPYLTDGHVDTFAFSGDNLKDYFPIEEGLQAKARVEDTIDTFTGIRKLKKLKTDITNNFLKMNHGKLSGSSDELGKTIEKLQKQAKSLNIKISEQKKNLETVEPIFDSLNKELEEYSEKQEKYNDEKERFITAISEKEAEINTNESSLSGNIKNLYSLSKNIQTKSLEFLGNLDKAKLPGVAREFFVELSEKPVCICDTKIGTHEKKCIIKNASDFLGGDDANLINGIKTVNKSRIETADVDDFYKELKNLGTLLNDLDDLNQELADHEEAHKAGAGASYQAKFKQRDNAKEEINKAKAEISKLTKDADESLPIVKKLRPSEIKSLWGINAALDHYENKRAKKLGFEDQKEAKDAFLECLDRAIVNSRQKIKEEIKEELNKKIASSHQDPSFLVEEIDSSLRLKGGGGSGGQQVTAVTCFALTMLERSGVDFPLIIDHPVTPIQAESRPTLSKMLVDICDQSICFVINTEKLGFTNKIDDPSQFQEHVKDKMNLFTVFRTDRNVDLPANEPDDILFQSKNCIVSNDHKFFNEFVLAKQES